MIIKKTHLLIIIITAFLIFSPLAGTTKGALKLSRTGKIRINGHSQYLGYLNAYLNLSKSGSTLTGQKVYLDTLLLNDQGGGLYTGGTPYPYDVSGGKTIVIKMIPKPSRILPATRERAKEIILGKYKLKNYIEWVYPRPDSKISFTRSLRRTVQFRWNYTGATLRTKVTIKNFTTNTEIFSTIVTAENVNVPRHIFVPGNRYRFDLEVVGPMGKFRLTKETALGSKIDFFYWAHMYFTVR
ncbi:MAG: hypothetical protein ABFR75_02150 [Acidobacteriota bacterium]